MWWKLQFLFRSIKVWQKKYKFPGEFHEDSTAIPSKSIEIDPLGGFDVHFERTSAFIPDDGGTSSPEVPTPATLSMVESMEYKASTSGKGNNA